MQDKKGILNLITSVKNHSKLYTNLRQNEKDDIKEWTAVAQECGISITEAQYQWNILMNEYTEYLKNNQDFGLAQHMDFLQPHFFAINDKENIDEMELLNVLESKNVAEKTSAYKERTEDEETKPKICLESQTQIRTEEVQKLKTQDPTVSKNSESKSECTSSAAPQENSITNMSSLELIFLGYAKQLQKMPLAMQLSTKRKIADIMDEAELQMMSL